MNPTINVNIGGYPFIIDEDAFDKLQEYLDIIEHHFSSSEGCEEIVHDIELRFAELLSERTNKRPIIGLRDVDQAIKILGTPEEFGAEDDRFRSRHENYDEEPAMRPKGKRLYRNPDDKVIGGVCSGLAAYFGMNDPIWIRLIFVISFAAGGAGFIVYLFLLIAVPKAKTPSDRLAMHGRPINVENIAQQVEDGIDQLTYKLDEISDKWTSKKKDKSKTTFYSSRFL